MQPVWMLDLCLVTEHRTPHIIPVCAGINPCRHRPIGPGIRASLLTIDLHHQITKNRHITRKPRRRSNAIIELQNTVRWKISGIRILLIGSTENSSGSELRNRYMVWVTIETIWPKSDHHVRSYLTEQAHKFRNNLSLVRLIHIAIEIIQKIDARDP